MNPKLYRFLLVTGFGYDDITESSGWLIKAIAAIFDYERANVRG
jgi:hypothetical protein